MIDPERDRTLAFQALHSILLCQVEIGEYRQARIRLWEMRPLYARYTGKLGAVKLRGLEGRIALGLGELDRAETCFLRAREGFEAAGQGFRAALASLDLAGVWLRQGRTAEIRTLVAEMIATFRAVGVEREALAALLLLRDAVEQDRATHELLEFVAGVLDQSERASPAKRNPG